MLSLFNDTRYNSDKTCGLFKAPSILEPFLSDMIASISKLVFKISTVNFFNLGYNCYQRNVHVSLSAPVLQALCNNRECGITATRIQHKIHVTQTNKGLTARTLVYVLPNAKHRYITKAPALRWHCARILIDQRAFD